MTALTRGARQDAYNHQTLFGSYSIQYDANGNATNIVSGTTTNRLVWSARNQLTNLTGSVAANFLYDGLGRRITRTVAGGTEKYLYDGLDIILQKDSGGTVKGRYFRGLAIDEPWQRIDVGSKASQTTNRVYLADALGSIVALTDPNKAITTEYDYQPFGVTTNIGAGNKNAYKFTGREDDGTGLMYYRARYYHPVLGRFVSEDPAGGDNLYGYCGGDPLNYSDPMGLDRVGNMMFWQGVSFLAGAGEGIAQRSLSLSLLGFWDLTKWGAEICEDYSGFNAQYRAGVTGGKLAFDVAMLAYGLAEAGVAAGPGFVSPFRSGAGIRATEESALQEMLTANERLFEAELRFHEARGIQWLSGSGYLQREAAAKIAWIEAQRYGEAYNRARLARNAYRMAKERAVWLP